MFALEHRGVPSLGDLSDPKATQARLYALMRDRLYGAMPPAPTWVRGELQQEEKEVNYAGKAIDRFYSLTFPTEKGEFTFPMEYIAPNDGKKHPFFVNICFDKVVPSRYLPVEEFIDRGYGLATFCYTDVSADSAVQDGLAQEYPSFEGRGDRWGKIGMWAFAASRVLDFILTLPQVDPTRVAVVGHSRLGKTALWAGANDPRFGLVISNESGCGGAAINRGKIGETLSGMTDVFPYWFCTDMQKLRGVDPATFDFDAHDLLALEAPRYLIVCSAQEDLWADPQSELLACHAATPMWEAYGETGLVAEEQPVLSKCFYEGKIGYHMRPGMHFMSRTDWNNFMDFRDKHNI